MGFHEQARDTDCRGCSGQNRNVLSLTTGDVRIFQLTEAGAAAAATVTAARYSVNEELN